MPSFIEVEYDPFAPVPVEHNPWEGQPDPFAYQPPVQRVADRRVEDHFSPPPDNRDMQVQAPGQNQFPNQMFGLLLHPNAAGIYGYGERPPPAGDVVLPSTGYRDASSRNAYIPQANESSTIRNFNESNLTGFRKISDAQRPYARAGGDVVLPPTPRQFDDQGLDQTYLQNQAEDRERALPPPVNNMVYRFPSDDLSQGDFVVGLNRNPQVGDKDMQSGIWTGPPGISKFFYPKSGYTNPFVTPEYGMQSSPDNPVLSDAPPEIPPGYSATRGEHSRYRRR